MGIKYNRKIVFIFTSFILLSSAVGFIAFYWASNTPTQTEFEIEAQQFKFTPDIIVVNKGDEVTLKIKSSDVTHGFYLDGYEIEYIIPALITTTIIFTATVDGRFAFRCSVTCGNFHPYMIGEIRVQPNYLFVFSILLASLISVLSIFRTYLRKSVDEERYYQPITN